MQSSVVTYAIGDIHGCGDLLDALLARIEDHAAGRERHLVFLGDYVDRGPDSAAVLKTVSRLHWSEPDRVTCLMGNHERMLLDAIQTKEAEFHWLDNGGEATLASFGVGEIVDIPQTVIDWIENLPTLHEDKMRWYVHAGFPPGSDPRASSDHDRLWIREPFLGDDRDFGRHVVHGHTPRRDGRPELRLYRTNLDTGAVYGGPLTAGVFGNEAGPALGFLQVGRSV